MVTTIQINENVKKALDKMKTNKETYEDVFILPEETVTGTDLGYIVFVEEKGFAKKREVEIISRSADKIAVRGGLKQGENLIIVGFQNLIDGERVTVIE